MLQKSNMAATCQNKGSFLLLFPYSEENLSMKTVIDCINILINILLRVLQVDCATCSTYGRRR